jgi:hypothetical protein
MLRINWSAEHARALQCVLDVKVSDVEHVGFVGFSLVSVRVLAVSDNDASAESRKLSACARLWSRNR